MVMFVSLQAQRKNPHVIAGNKLYRENKFDKALPEYHEGDGS